MKATPYKSSRTEILARAALARFPDTPLPEVPSYTWPGDPVGNFVAALTAYDGKAVFMPSRADAILWLDHNLDIAGRRIYSAIPDYVGNVAAASVADPHRAVDIDICVADGLIGVGETGSVWVTDTSLRIPACALLATDLYLLLPRQAIVDGIHSAYTAISLRDHAYGSFFTGPSATADIEAIHISGAQGPVTLTVVVHD